MSKPETRARILEAARTMFNERGLDGVGVRDLARSLALSPGNLSYWFPRKEDLVAALADEQRARNAALLAEVAAAERVGDWLVRYRAVFESQWEGRFLARALPELVQRDPSFAARYRLVEAERRQALARTFGRLEAAGALEALDEPGRARLVGTCTLVARFWVAEAGLSHPDLPPDAIVRHYVALLAHALLPYASAQARTELAPWLGGVLGGEERSAAGPAR